MSKKCKIHGSELLTDRVKIRSGMPPAPPRGYLEAAKSTFPNAHTWMMGGCVMSVPQRYTGKVAYCPNCRDKQAKWWFTHGGDDFWTP